MTYNVIHKMCEERDARHLMSITILISKDLIPCWHRDTVVCKTFVSRKQYFYIYNLHNNFLSTDKNQTKVMIL